jgi:hypothetical protein
MMFDRTGKLVTATVLLASPSIAQASDPTPLFVAFFGLPAVTLAIAILALSYLRPRFALVPSLVLLVAHVPLMIWARHVGYMAEAGHWLYISSGLTSCALVISIVRRKAAHPREERGT